MNLVRIDISELMQALDRTDDVACYCPSCDKFCKLSSMYEELVASEAYSCYYQCANCEYEFGDTRDIVEHNRKYSTNDD